MVYTFEKKTPARTGVLIKSETMLTSNGNCIEQIACKRGTYSVLLFCLYCMENYSFLLLYMDKHPFFDCIFSKLNKDIFVLELFRFSLFTVCAY